MIKLLIGGSPCTYWSIAQKNNRETKAEGIGWELFKNYLIAKEKFKPDFFLYENNKSASSAIKAQIREELGVCDPVQIDMFRQDTGARYIEINSALVSAQNRQRFYIHNCGNVEQPEDRGIMLRDIIECGVTDKEKAFEPVLFSNPHGFNKGGAKYGKAPTLTATGKYVYNNRIFVPVCVTPSGKSQTIKAQYMNSTVRNFCCYHSTYGATGVAEQVGVLPREDGQCTDSKPYRVYGTGGKSVTICGNGGGLGAKAGLYALPVDEHKCYATSCEWDENGEPTKAVSCADGKTYQVYKVADGKITIKGKEYPIKLADGYWIIRKLTVTECCRLQTLPDDYCRAVSDTQAYKGIGNGWTAEVIIHILNAALKDVPQNEKILVLSMYDGIGTGRYCLDKMGFKNVEYHAYEIDKCAIKVAMSNYPDIIQHGDAFKVREDGWRI